ncbi:restriction endonuclease subunit S [Roseburia rectibacter]|uniref:restriction endonuclease subunit S n=1 Tax=Roseburia rectibacter TaxID=2763062 RepID=UPI0021131A3D|nr:restriction endonuclease subunit S [Roseburia rectibacter]
MVHNGDTIISTVRTYLKAIAYIDNSLADKIVSTGFSVVTPHKDVVAKFLYYALSTHSFISNVEAHSVGISYPAINNTNLMDLKIVLPMQREQIQIASYLDAKCSKIDEIIEKQQAIIEKLKEYKFSIITEAVTKGINTDVELKDSTIDMCEQIPVHWSISQNRYLFSLRDEKNYKPLEEVRLLSLYTDLGVFPHGEQEERGNKAVKAEGYKVVYENDIVVNIILAWMGAIGRSAYDGVTSPAYDIYKPNENVCSRYYHYLYRTKPFSAECYKYGRGIMAMRWRTYSSEFKSIKVPVPPYIEQCQIADYLDSKCEMLDKTIADRNKAIEKLQEYKKSLIYEVVTGKKEV